MTQVGRISFGNLYPTTLGFDEIFRHLERTLEQPVSQSFPPHNIIKLDDNKYVVELAVAGFSKEDIDITIEDNQLIITGNKTTSEENVTYLHKGIGTRSFTKTIRVLDTIEVRGAEFKDGILRVGLENIIPDHKKPRKVEISGELTFEQPQLLTE
jgi:molecular chaperone IbpA